ncbi:class I adenylate-forming enzyme family protein [Niveispirillum sp. KHB5.9]|uniref:class I adenylate-forming enzyme family protein n=1 Tax=Niveispirillum sp. KHB5.9 TaxID=3400269 RepID=UPI003A8758B6
MSKADQFIHATTLGDLLLSAAYRWPDTDALIFPMEKLTYRDLASRALRYAKGLMALGVRPGDHVGVLLPSCIDFVDVLFGVSLAGAVTVPINARYRAHELAYVVENADLVTIVTTEQVADQLNFVDRLCEGLEGLATQADPMDLRLPGCPRLRSIVLLGEGGRGFTVEAARFDALAGTVSDEAVHERRAFARVRDPGIVLYTSGTTSNPKGCLISHEAIVRTSQALAERYELTGRDRFWSPLPLFHIAAILPLVAIYAVGGTYLSMQHFDAGVALKMLETYKVTATYPCFAPIMVDLIHHPDFVKTDLSSMRLMNSSLAVQTGAIKEMLAKAMPNCIQVGTYGLSEAAGTVCTSRLDDSYEVRTTRLGRPLPGIQVRIVDALGNDLPAGQKGEILVRGPGLLDGYYKDPVKTADALRDGWLHSGDVGSLDADGNIMFHGRTKDMLKVGGENVAAAEIEAYIGGHPAVKLCQVVGVPDPRLTEVAAAFIELHPGTGLTAQEVVDFCRGKISSFKVPRHVRFVTAWPMSASKIQKYKLRQQLEAELAIGAVA